MINSHRCLILNIQCFLTILKVPAAVVNRAAQDRPLFRCPELRAGPLPKEIPDVSCGVMREAHLLRPSSFCKLKISIDLAFSSSWDPAKRDDQTLLVTCFFFILQCFFHFPCATNVVWLFAISYLITFMQICWVLEHRQQDQRSLLSEALNLSVHGCHGTNHLSPEQKDKTR